MKFGTVHSCPSSGRRSARTDDNVDTVESLLMSQEDKTSEPPKSEKFHVRRGDPLVICFADYSQRSAFQAGHAQQLTEAHSMHTLFSVCSLRDDNVITSKPTRKLKHANFILES